MALRSGEPAGCQALKERDYKAFLLIPFALSTGWVEKNKWPVQCDTEWREGCQIKRMHQRHQTEPSVWSGLCSLNCPGSSQLTFSWEQDWLLKKRAERLSTPVSKLSQHVPHSHIEESCRGRARQGSLTPHPPFKSICGKAAAWLLFGIIT